MEGLKELLTGPTALTFVRGDAASAAKAIATFNKETQLLEFKGGVMNGETLEIDQIKAIAKLPSRDVLYGQLVGVVAAPLTGLARGLGGLLGGLAVALGQIQQKKESGELPAGEAPAAVADEPVAASRASEAEVAEAPAADSAEAPADDAEAQTADEGPAAEADADAGDETNQDNENEADASA